MAKIYSVKLLSNIKAIGLQKWPKLSRSNFDLKSRLKSYKNGQNLVGQILF